MFENMNCNKTRSTVFHTNSGFQNGAYLDLNGLRNKKRGSTNNGNQV